MAQPAGTPVPPGSYAYDQNSTNPDRKEGQLTIEATEVPNQFKVSVRFKNADGTWADVKEEDISILRLDDDPVSSTFGCYIPLASGEDVGLIEHIGTDAEIGEEIKAGTNGSEGTGTASRGT